MLISELAVHSPYNSTQDTKHGNTMDGIWDDGEWISWDDIDRHIYLNDLQEAFPEADVEVIEIFEDLVDAAQRYRSATGRHLAVFGELGELYAEIKFGSRAGSIV